MKLDLSNSLPSIFFGRVRIICEESHLLHFLSILSLASAFMLRLRIENRKDLCLVFPHRSTR